MSKPIPVLEAEFYHDGRGPELQKVVWDYRGQILRGFEYFNPDVKYSEENLRHLALDKVEAYSMASEEVHKRIAANGKSNAAISGLSIRLGRHLSSSATYKIASISRSCFTMRFLT